jgi:dCMP deaminase
MEGDFEKLSVSQKRTDFISWDEMHMSIAMLASMRSKDPSTQVGSVIVNSDDNKILGIGYNGFCRGINDDEFPWCKSRETSNILECKSPYGKIYFISLILLWCTVKRMQY